MTVGCRQISCQGRDSRHGTRLRLHVAVGKPRSHAVLERAIHTRNGHRGEQMIVDVRIAVGIAQEGHLQLCRHIVIEREARTVGNIIVAGIHAHFLYQPVHHCPPGLCRGLAASRCCQLVEHRLGIKVVRILHHAVQYLVDGVRTGAYLTGSRGRCAAQGIAYEHDAGIAKLLQETAHETVFLTHQQGRERGVVVVPAPSFAPSVAVLHRQVGTNVAAYGVHPQPLHALHEGVQVVDVERRVHAALAIKVSTQHTRVYLARIVEARPELIVAAQLIERGHGINHLHRRGRTHLLALVILVDHGVGRQVVHLQSYLRGLELPAQQNGIQPCLHVLGPRQRHGLGYGVHGHGVFHERVLGYGQHRFVGSSIHVHFLRQNGRSRHEQNREHQKKSFHHSGYNA